MDLNFNKLAKSLSLIYKEAGETYKAVVDILLWPNTFCKTGKGFLKFVS